MDKPALRAKLRAVRDAFPPAPFPPGVEPFAQRLAPGLVIASYVPVGNEVDPIRFNRTAVVCGCRLALPHFGGRADPMRFLAWPGDAALVPGPFGIRQPAADLPELIPHIVLVPLVAFNRRGVRLGQGGGHYDRYFSAYPRPWRLGLAWSVQEMDALEADEWDAPLDAIVTEKEWIIR
jgi:5-formyltetrahydrofolate cyclo-ligase